LAGGSDGIYIYVRPELAVAGFKLVDLENPVRFYYFVFAALIGVYAFLYKIQRSPFGRALAGIKLNELRMRSLGYRVFWYKLGAFTLAGALAGMAGYLAACQFGFVNPEILAWHQSGVVLMMVILGGMGKLHGPVLGAFAYVLLQEVFSASALIGAYAKHWQLAMGALIVLIALALPYGLAGVGGVSRRFSELKTNREAAIDDD
jgi:branched-chain amino acid transport system permease protein